MKEELRRLCKDEEVRECLAGIIRDTIRKHLPKLQMLHLEVEKAVFPLPRDMIKLEVDRRDNLDRAKLNVILGKVRQKNRKRKRSFT